MHYEIFQREWRREGYYVAANFWERVEDFRAGKPAALINDFKFPGIRLIHQRILRGPNGGHLHCTGAEVMPSQRRDFLDAEGYRWAKENGRIVTDSRGRWLPTGRRGAPAFPFAYEKQFLDPQWQREPFAFPWNEQVDMELTSYAARAFALGWHGDRRGTTLVVQVGTSLDDGNSLYQTFIGDFYDTNMGMQLGTANLGDDWADSFYVFSFGLNLRTASISNAVVALWGDQVDSGTPTTKIFVNKIDGAATAPTSFSDHQAKTRTSAGTNWDSLGLSTSAFTNGASMHGALQEQQSNLTGGNTFTGCVVLHDHRSSAFDGWAYPVAYDGNTAHAPKLTIDYTLPTILPKPHFRRPIYKR